MSKLVSIPWEGLRLGMEGLLKLAFPQVCEGCGKDRIQSADLLCAQCLHQLPLTQFHTYEHNPVERVFWGRLPLEAASSQYYFTKGSLMQQLMHQLKYKDRPDVGRALGRMMGAQLRDGKRFGGLQALVPLPLYAGRLKSRGYNQAAMLCEGLSEVLHLPVLHNLVHRPKATESQTSKSRIERWQNMETGFSLTKDSGLSDLHILLVDDVITTGATLEACGRTLLQLPGCRLSIATLCFSSH